MRSAGHKRRVSEFIGGDGTSTGPGLMSSSPTKIEGALPSPPMSGHGPLGGRRGHAHRRSGAISHHDLSSIIQPNKGGPGSKHGSAPSTPSDPSGTREFNLGLNRRASSQPLIPLPDLNDQLPSNEDQAASQPSPGKSRPRVGFSDTLEFIPGRPLSQISSETSSSLSTIRPTHSVANSISSVITPSPPSARRPRMDFDSGRELGPGSDRPRSASILGGSPPSFATNLDRLKDLPPSGMSGSPAMLRNRRARSADLLKDVFFNRGREDTESSSLRVEKSTPTRRNDDREGGGAAPSPLGISRNSATAFDIERPQTSPVDGISKRQPRVKSWAGSILSKKSKSPVTDEHPFHSQRRPATPSASRDLAPLDCNDLDDVNFDEDTDYVIRDPTYAQPTPTFNPASLSRPRRLRDDHRAEDSAGVLDLDAAWESLDSSSSSTPNSPWSNSTGAPSPRRRQLHSGGATGGFIGPGMHYHRRAESAPVMAPIDYPAFAVRRMSSKTTMDDVFEEDEEDEDQNRKPGKEHDGLERENDIARGVGVQITGHERCENGVAQGSPKLLQDSRDVDAMTTASASTASELSAPSFDNGAKQATPELSVEIANEDDEPRFSVITKSSDDASITPTLSHNPANELTQPPSHEYPYPGAKSYSDRSETTSAVSSPDFGDFSFDAPRLNTATSSVTDHTTWSSSRPTDSGLCYYSTDDVRSLAGSASAAMSHHYPPRPSTTDERSLGERPPPVAAVLVGRRNPRPVNPIKRASLVSLSRLVGGTFCEKNEPSIESGVQSEGAEPSAKKKGNRISRLMRFWKSKEKLNS